MIKDDLNLGMFKAYDIRTKCEKLSPVLLRRLASSIAAYIRDTLKADKAVIGRDARLAAPDVIEILLEIFPRFGIEVFVNPLPISTCQFYFMCMQHSDAAGVMVTASHNPWDYIGFKLLAPGNIPLAYGYGPRGGIEEIKRLYLEDSSAPHGSKKRVHVCNALDSFISYSMELSGVRPGSLRGLRVLAEFLSGSAGMETAAAFVEAGAELEARHLIPDGNFPSGDPNPIIESSIKPARDAMKEGDYDFGLCFDGDGDRMDMMDGMGNQIVPGFNISVLLPYIRKIFDPAFGSSYIPRFYADVKAIPLALREMAAAGMDVHIIRNGHSFIKAKLMENFRNGYLASEEESAHYYMNFPISLRCWDKGTAATENTLFFALLTARAWTERREEYERMMEVQRSFARIREWPLHFDAAPQMMQPIMDEVEAVMRKKGACIVRTMDDGSDLDAVLMRFGLPADIDASASFDGSWCQVAQRISRSEDAMTRWEVVASDEAICREYNSLILEVADRYVARGYARY